MSTHRLPTIVRWTALWSVLTAPLAGQSLEIAAPAFWAVSVADLNRSTAWYQEVFDVSVVREVEARDGSGRARILRAGPLVIELIARNRSVDVRSLLGDDAHDFDARGLVKVGLHVADARAWHSRVTGLRVRSDPRVFMDETLGMRTFVMRDPDGNRIQLFERVDNPGR